LKNFNKEKKRNLIFNLRNEEIYLSNRCTKIFKKQRKFEFLI